MGTTPSLLKTWRIQKDLVVAATGAPFDQGVVKSWIDGLLAAGAGAPTCRGSANASAHGLDGVNRIAAITDWVLGTSWIVIRFTSGAELLIAAGIAQYNNRITLRVSPSAGFTGGNHTGTYPSAADEIVVRADGAWNNGEGAVAQVARSHIWQSTDGLCTRIVYYKTTGSGGAATNMQCFLTIEVPKGPPAAWTAPIAVMFSQTGFAGAHANAVANVASAVAGLATINGVACTWACGTVGACPTAYIAPVRQVAANDVSGDWQAFPMAMVVETATRRGYYGQLSDVWFSPTSAADGVVYPADTTRQLIQMGGMILPWDGSARTPDTKNPIDIAALSVGADAPPTAPVIAITPANGSAIARYDTIQVDITHALGLLNLASIAIWVSFNAGGPAADVTWEPIMVAGNIDGGYAGWATKAAITNGQRHTLKRPGGWRANWTLAVQAFDTNGHPAA